MTSRRGGKERGRRVTPRGAALMLVIAGLLLSAIYPGRQLVAQRRVIEDLHAEERRLDARIAELKEQRGRLQTDEEIERLAREELGMVRPGEVAFAILPEPRTEASKPDLDKPAAKAKAASKPRPDEPKRPWYERLWDAIFG